MQEHKWHNRMLIRQPLPWDLQMRCSLIRDLCTKILENEAERLTEGRVLVVQRSLDQQVEGIRNIKTII